MERAECLKIAAGAAQREIGADYLDNIVGRSDLLDGLCCNGSHALDFSLVPVT